MLKSSVLGSLVCVPFLVVACSSDSSTEGDAAGTGGAHAGSTSTAGASGAHVNGGASGPAGATNRAGETSQAGNSPEGDAGGEGEDAGADAGGHAGLSGLGGTSGGGGVAGHGGTSGAGGVAGHGGTSGAGGVAGHGGTSGSGGASGSSGAAGHAGAGSTCTSSAQCASTQVCVSSTCTACDAVAFSAGATVYFVDPANGSDSNATGSGSVAGQAQNACAFKTITRALQVVGKPTQASGATIKLKGNASVATGEAFPISVPQYVAIQSATGSVTVTIPADKVGFSFDGTGSVLKNLVLDGGGTSGTGVRLNTTAYEASLDGVTVQNTAGTAVSVGAGTLTLLAGTTVQQAGTNQAHQEGITVEGTGKLVAKIAAGKVSVLKNTGQGIRVSGRGSIDLEGVVTSNTSATPTTFAGTIVISQNNEANLELSQTGATPPLNILKGVLATGSVTSDGLLVFGGTAVSARKSVFVGNGQGGIHLLHTGSRANGVSDVSAVDLGKVNDPGQNVLQGANDQLNNNSAGLCIDLDPATTQVISAQGNLFAPADCSLTATPLTKNLGACAPVATKPDDLGWAWVTAGNTSKVTVDSVKCN